VSYLIYRDSFRVRRNKSGEVWSSDLGDLDVESYPPKVHISEDHISAKGVLRPQIFTRTTELPSLTSAPPTEDGGPPYNFFQRGVKNCLKM